MKYGIYNRDFSTPHRHPVFLRTPRRTFFARFVFLLKRLPFRTCCSSVCEAVRVARFSNARDGRTRLSTICTAREATTRYRPATSAGGGGSTRRGGVTRHRDSRWNDYGKNTLRQLVRTCDDEARNK